MSNSFPMIYFQSESHPDCTLSSGSVHKFGCTVAQKSLSRGKYEKDKRASSGSGNETYSSGFAACERYMATGPCDRPTTVPCGTQPEASSTVVFSYVETVITFTIYLIYNFQMLDFFFSASDIITHGQVCL